MCKFISKQKLLVFYVLAFSISWTSWYVMSIANVSDKPTIVVYIFSTVGGLGPLLSLLLVHKWSDEELNLKVILSRIHVREAKSIWGILAIIAMPIATLLGGLGYFLMGREDQFRIIKTGPDEMGIFVVLVIIVQFAAALVTSPLFEEPGWRGFALVNLQKKYGRTIGSLVVAFLWWLWHQPMNLTFGLDPTIYSTLTLVVSSFIIDSLFNLNNKSLFTAMLAHQSMGTINTFLYQGQENWLTLIFKIIFLRWKEIREIK